MRLETFYEKPRLSHYCVQGKMVVDWVEYWQQTCCWGYKILYLE